MTERDTFIRAIAEAWDDPTPVLVFADWAEEHRTDNPVLLRWYGWHVMPALAAVAPRRTRHADLSRAHKSVRSHPQADALIPLAAVAFCRRPSIWDGAELQPVQSAAVVTRLFAIGLVTKEARRQAFVAASTREGETSYAITMAYDNNDATEVARLTPRMQGHRLAKELLNAAGKACAELARSLAGPENTRAEQEYQTAVYEALAAVPPLVEVIHAPNPETVHEVEQKPLPPMKLPRNLFRRIVVRGRAYGWRLVSDRGISTSERAFHIDEIVVRSADNTGQRLRVRFGYYVWHLVEGQQTYPTPALAARLIADALDGGWTPTADGLPDFALDGSPYLPRSEVTKYG